MARDAGVTVSFDLNYRSALWPVHEAAPALEAAVRSADVVFAGEHEAEIVTETADPLQAALALEALGPAQVMIKRGAEGCLARIGGTTIEQPAPAVTVVDTVGAGDACVAGYLAELISGAEPAVRLATAVAAARSRSPSPATGRECPTADRWPYWRRASRSSDEEEQGGRRQRRRRPPVSPTTVTRSPACRCSSRSRCMPPS